MPFSYHKKRHFNGILLVDKFVGITSNCMLQKIKYIYQAVKAGHTGNLDPLASGLLPICFGDATKISTFLLNKNKCYWAHVKLGVKTTTADSEGEIVKSYTVRQLSKKRIFTVLNNFIGEINQYPPMYSALKYHGVRLYKLARKGINIRCQPRRVIIYSIKILGIKNNTLKLYICCSKGTYIRTLAEDIGAALGCGSGHITMLRRTQLGPYNDDMMITINHLKKLKKLGGFKSLKTILKPVDSVLMDLPRIQLSINETYYLKQGQAVKILKPFTTSSLIRIYGFDNRFLGIGEINNNGLLIPKRLFLR